MVVRGPRESRGPGRGQGGATLLELMVAVAVMGVVVVPVLLIWSQGLVAYFQASETADLQQEARIAHERVTLELRKAGMNPCFSGVPPVGSSLGVTAATASSVTVTYFPAQLDCSTAPASNTMRTVTYSYDDASGSIQRNLNGAGAQSLTGGTIQSLTFQYFPCGVNPVAFTTPVSNADRPNIARIVVTTRANETFPQGTGGTLTRSLASSVSVRSIQCAA